MFVCLQFSQTEPEISLYLMAKKREISYPGEDQGYDFLKPEFLKPIKLCVVKFSWRTQCRNNRRTW